MGDETRHFFVETWEPVVHRLLEEYPETRNDEIVERLGVPDWLVRDVAAGWRRRRGMNMQKRFERTDYLVQLVLDTIPGISNSEIESVTDVSRGTVAVRASAWRKRSKQDDLEESKMDGKCPRCTAYPDAENPMTDRGVCLWCTWEIDFLQELYGE